MYQLSHNDQNGVTIIQLSGKILGGQDSMEVNELINNLMDQGKHRVVMDLSEVELMNSSGLGIIIQSANLLKNKGGGLKLANISKKIESLLVITKLNTIFDSYDTIDDAINSF